MKKTLVFMAVMLIPAITLAENPDSRPSITIGINSRTISTDSEPVLLGLYFDPETIDYSFKLTLPSTKDVTLHTYFAIQNALYDRTKIGSYRTLDFGVAVTFYIGESINK